ncbi:MAG: hypothetical protein KDE31_27780, partial [Caldilineaceae bacterium]|nr:hypothetical protein [Caldilineaceae bacterium]
WHLADTLQEALMHIESKPDDSRFTVTDIDDYLDDWNISGLDVTELTLAEQLDLIDIAAEESSAILNRVFNSDGNAAVDEMVSLLFAGEETARTATLGATDDQEIDTNTLHFDLSAETLDTIAILRWAPYTYEGASTWDSAEISDYADQLSLDLATVFTDSELDTLVGTETTSAESISDYDLVQSTVLQLAKNYYYAFYVGLSATVAIDGESVTSGALGDHSRGATEVVTTIVQALLAQIQTYYGDRSVIQALTETADGTTAAANALSATFAESVSVLLESLGTAVEGNATTALTLAFQELGDYYKTTDVDTASFTDFTGISALAWASSAATLSNSEYAIYAGYKLASSNYTVAWGIHHAYTYSSNLVKWGHYETLFERFPAS